AHSCLLLTLVVHRYALRRGKGKFRCIDSAILLRFELIAAALIVLLNGAELIDGTVSAYIDGELLQVAVAAFWRQDKLITVLLNIILLPVAGLVTGYQHKGRVAGRIFQPGGGCLLNKRVEEPQGFAVRDQDALIRLSHVPVEKIWAFYPQIALAFLHCITAAVSHFLREAGVEAAHFIQAAFKVAGRISPDAAGDKTGE